MGRACAGCVTRSRAFSVALQSIRTRCVPENECRRVCNAPLSLLDYSRGTSSTTPLARTSHADTLQTLTQMTSSRSAARGGIRSNPDLLSVSFNQDSTCVLRSYPCLSASLVQRRVQRRRAVDGVQSELTPPCPPAAASQPAPARATPSQTATRSARSTAAVSLQQKRFTLSLCRQSDASVLTLPRSRR